MQQLIDDMVKEDPKFKATVEIAAVERTSYTGKSLTVANKKEAWKIPSIHPFVQAASRGVDQVGQPVKTDYMEKAIAGYVSIFLEMMNLPLDSFKL